MCGITGFAPRPGSTPIGRDVLERMVASLTHRGPDDDGFFVENGVGLGHRRLSIIAVATGRNPLRDAAGEAVLVFNGEIYNHLELRVGLERAGRRPESGSDGEVILHGYLEWGLAGLLERLRGMFAFALLDRRDGSVHLARDPLGIKPLYLAQTADALLFGSEIKAICEALDNAPRPDPRGWFESACLGYTIGPTTAYEGIEALPPGHSLSWVDGRATRRRYFELAFEPGRHAADPDELWSRLSAAVSSHLMTEVPLGAFLSGGIDSSAVVTAMSGASPDGVDAVCVGVDAQGMDERPFAREVAAGLGVRLHEESATTDLLALLPRLAWHNEGPFADTSSAPTWLVCEAARRHVTVVLSGDGGDENFAGYRRTRFDLLEEHWRARLPAALRRGLLGPLGALWPTGTWLPRPLRAGTLLRNLGGDWLDGYVRSLCRIDEARARSLLRPEWRDGPALRESFAAHAARHTDLDPLSRVLAMDFATWLPDDILLKVDRASMAHGLEVRVPLLDTDFVSWAAGLPGDAKLAGGEGKVLLKRALRGRVPDAVLDRPKQGFHLPVAAWLRGPLAAHLDAVLGAPDAGVFDLLDRDVLLEAARRHASGRHDHGTELWWLLVADAFVRHGPAGTDR